MDARRTTPPEPMRQHQRRLQPRTAGDPFLPACFPRRISAQRRNLSPLPGAKDERPAALGRPKRLADVNHPRRPVSPAPQQQHARGVLSNTVGDSTCQGTNEGTGMREFREVRSVPMKETAPGQAMTIMSNLATGADEEGKEISFSTTTTTMNAWQVRFESAINILNSMIKEDTENIDARAFVTRFRKGKTEAHLSKEELLPLWIIVNGNSVMAIDLNGTSLHHNYSGFCASPSTNFPPTGCIVFPLLDKLKKGEVQLPRNRSEVEAMMMPSTKEVEWGVPIGVLFINPQERDSIVNDICQFFLPSFLKVAYPFGVLLKGAWLNTLPTEKSTTPRVLEITTDVKDSIMSFVTEVGVSNMKAFAGDGNRLVETQRNQNSQQRETTPLHVSAEKAVVNNPEKKAISIHEGKKILESPNDINSNVSSPWESKGKQPIFTARLIPSSHVSSFPTMPTPCHAVLVLTPRGPLELLAEPPSADVTVKDVKMSLLRSGLGRSLRLKQNLVRLMYAPSFPVIDENELINARFVVMRLQTQK